MNQTRAWIFATVMSVLLTCPVIAQPQPAAPSTLPAAERVLPELKLEDVTLDDAVEFIRDAVPGLNIAIVRSPGVPGTYPILQKLSLKNVTVGMFLELISTSYEHVEVDEVSGPDGDSRLIVLRITGPRNGGEEETVQVYPLAEVIIAVASRKQGEAKEREALSDVLSLIEAAIAEAGVGGTKPVIKVHEGTQTLLFKGNKQTMRVVENALAAVQPNAVEDSASSVAARMEERRQLEKLRTELAGTIDKLRQTKEAAAGQTTQPKE